MCDLLRVAHLRAVLPGTAKVLGPEEVRQAVPAQARNVLTARGEGSTLRWDEPGRHGAPSSERVDDDQEPG